MLVFVANAIRQLSMDMLYQGMRQKSLVSKCSFFVLPLPLKGVQKKNFLKIPFRGIRGKKGNLSYTPLRNFIQRLVPLP